MPFKNIDISDNGSFKIVALYGIAHAPKILEHLIDTESKILGFLI